MANYLPVLLVSLSTNALNAVPDDSALSTAPRAQVDYLSHDWEEEDVWRSWRNMTRQKNAITNGARLENASWRTWWKQRNKLGTVSPETLNWLKDSDVTWLYGPLHTAEDWKPPPRHPPDIATNPAPARPNSPAGHRACRPPRPAPYKPILKHRSISELLTSELPPTSPILSPLEFWEGPEPNRDLDAHLDTNMKRPPLLHTKSDTQITRWSSSRSFKQTSPLRVDPRFENGADQSSPLSSQRLSADPVRASLSQDSNSSGKSGVSGSEHSRDRQKKKHISFNTYVQQCIAIDKPKKNASGYFGAIPATYLGGRAAWVDDDGYDEDSEEDTNPRVYLRNPHWKPVDSQSYGVRVIREEDDSPDEDDEDDDAPIEISLSSSRSIPTARREKKLFPRSHSKVSNSSSSSASTTTVTSRSDASRSTTDDTPSPSGSLSPTRRISSSSDIPPKDLLGHPHPYGQPVATISVSNYRSSHRQYPPQALRSSFESNSRSQHVTIAPIAPTLLKTTPAPSWTENFGDDGTGSGDDIFANWAWGIGGKVGASDSANNRREDRDQDRLSSGLHRRRSWSSGFGSESHRFAAGIFGRDLRGVGLGATALDSGDDGHAYGTPVELVYAPPFNFSADENFVEHDEPALLEEESGQRCMEEEDMEIEQVEDVDVLGNHFHHSLIDLNGDSFSSHIVPNVDQLPTVVIDSCATTPLFGLHGEQSFTSEAIAADEEDQDGDLLDITDAHYPWRGRPGYDYSTSAVDAYRGRPSNPKSSTRLTYTAHTKQRAREMEQKLVGNEDNRLSRSRSRSESRTPSPALMSPPEPNLNDERPRSYSGSSPLKNSLLPSTPSTRKWSSHSDLLSPPRGRQLDGPSSRSANLTSPPQEERRGRSNVRVSPSSSWDRGSSGSLGSSASPLGSLSPDGGGIRGGLGTGVGLAVALGGGKVEKDREKDWDREKERGSRHRKGREKTKAQNETPVTPPVGKKPDTSIFSVASSSSSSTSSTVMPVPAGASGQEQEKERCLHIGEMSNSDASARSPMPETEDSTPTGNGAPTQMVGAPTPEKGAKKIPPIRTRNVSAPSSLSPPLSPSTTSPQRSSKYRAPVTLRPSPPMPVRPSTSLASAVSPIGIANHGTVVVNNDSAQSDNTIVGKAVDIVSNAGMYLGLWGRERVTSLSSGSPT